MYTVTCEMKDCAVCVCVCSCSFMSIRLFAALWTIVHQASLSMGILQARPLEWVPFLPPGDLPNPGIKPESLSFPALGRQVLYHKCHLGILSEIY